MKTPQIFTGFPPSTKEVFSANFCNIHIFLTKCCFFAFRPRKFPAVYIHSIITAHSIQMKAGTVGSCCQTSRSDRDTVLVSCSILPSHGNHWYRQLQGEGVCVYMYVTDVHNITHTHTHAHTHTDAFKLTNSRVRQLLEGSAQPLRHLLAPETMSHR